MLYRIDQVCFPPGIAYSRAELRYYIQHPKSFTVLAEDDAGSVVAFCTGRLYTREGRVYGHVITIDVLPKARRQGLGRELLSAIEKYCEAGRAEMIRLEVAVNNDEARAFYQKMGYSDAGRIRGYYAGRLDAIVMQKALRECA